MQILLDSNPRRKQLYSVRLVERKRLDRTLPAIINGLGACEAKLRGLFHDPSDPDTSRVSKREPLFISEDSDEESQGNSRSSKTKNESKSMPNTSTTINTGAAARPTFSFESANTKPFSSHDGTFPGISSAAKTKPGQTSQFSFGKPSSVTGHPMLPTNSSHSPVLSEQQLSPQLGSLSDDAKSGTEQNPFGSEVRVTESSAKPDVSSQSVARPAPGTSISLTKGSHVPVLEPKFSQPGNPEGLLGGAKPDSPTSVEKGSIQLNNVSPSSTYISRPDDRIVPPVQSRQQLAPEELEASQHTSSTECSSLPHQIFSPATKTSFAAPQVFTTTAGTAKPSSSSVRPHAPSTSSTSTASQPRASLVPTQDASLPATTDKQASSSAGPESIMRPNSEGISAVLANDSDRRTTVIDVLSQAVMHDDGGLLQQFVEYMVRPSIADAIRQLKDERSWRQASQSLSVPSRSLDHAKLNQGYADRSYY